MRFRSSPAQTGSPESKLLDDGQELVELAQVDLVKATYAEHAAPAAARGGRRRLVKRREV